MTYTLKRATQADAGTVNDLLQSRARWLAENGHTQWSEKDPTRTTVATIEAGETWLLVDDLTGVPVGTMTMTTRVDRDFWHDNVPALYLSKLATRLDQAGNGLGELLVHAAYLYGHQHKVTLLRWDVWRTNAQLQNYYRAIGGKLVDVVRVAGRNSGALFEMTDTMHARVFLGESAQRVSIDSPIGVVAELEFDTEHESTTIGYGGDLDDLRARHWHNLVGINDATGTPYRFDPAIVVPQVLYSDGAGWWVRTRSGPEDSWRTRTEPVSGSILEGLRVGWPYLLNHRSTFGECFVDVVGDLAASVPNPSTQQLVEHQTT